MDVTGAGWRGRGLDFGMSRAAVVTIGEEREERGGWVFGVRVAGDGEYEVRLSWVDYDHLGGGSASPASVVSAVVSAASESGVLDGLGRSFDVARAVRRVPGGVGAVRSSL